MSAVAVTANQARGASPFSRAGMLAVVLVGFAAFVAMLYFIGIGDTGEQERGGSAHASANGINGYSGLVRLLEGEGYDVERSRGREGLETTDLLILTPPKFTDPEEFATILQNREYLGPTLVILPKWNAGTPDQDNVAEEDADRMQSDWVTLNGANAASWTENLPVPFKFTSQTEELGDDETANWKGLNRSGILPTKAINYTEEGSSYEAVITDAAGHILALNIVGEAGTEYYENSHWTMFVVEPDLMNNYRPRRCHACRRRHRSGARGGIWRYEFGHIRHDAQWLWQFGQFAHFGVSAAIPCGDIVPDAGDGDCGLARVFAIWPCGGSLSGNRLWQTAARQQWRRPDCARAAAGSARGTLC